MNNELIARYIYAVTRHLPQKIRADVEQELDSLIADMLTQRCGDVLPTDKDVRVILTELGDPEEMAAQYSGDENKALISGTYYLIYKRILCLVLPIAAAGIAFAGILSACLDWQPNTNPFEMLWSNIGQTIGGIIGGSIQAFAAITIVFAILERKKVNFKEGDMLSHLPIVPKKDACIKPHEPIINMMWSVFAAVFFLGFPQIAGAWLEGSGWIPAFDTQVIRGFWLPIVLWAVLGIAKEAVKLIDGQYTIRLAVTTLIANVLILISTAFVFLNNRLLNAKFVRHISDWVTGEDSAMIRDVLGNLGVVFFGVLCLVFVLETVVTAVKAWKYSSV